MECGYCVQKPDGDTSGQLHFACSSCKGNGPLGPLDSSVPSPWVLLAPQPASLLPRLPGPAEARTALQAELDSWPGCSSLASLCVPRSDPCPVPTKELARGHP